jgi:hypothetical protein
MPNEFVARNGFISNSGSVVTGSLTVTGGITGSILSASYSITSSYSFNTATASFVISAITASRALSASTADYALTASAWSKPSYAPTQTVGYISPQLAFGEITGSVGSRPGINNILATPFLVHKDCTLDGLYITFCSSGSGIATTASLGIYSDNGNTLPQTLIRAVGTAMTNSSSLFQHALIAPSNLLPPVQLKAKTMYWVAIVGDDGLVLPIINGTIPNLLYNPILGVSVTASAIVSSFFPVYKNITSYGFVSASAGNPAVGLPATLPQTAASYVVNSYTTQSNFILPLISVTYG